MNILSIEDFFFAVVQLELRIISDRHSREVVFVYVVFLQQAFAVFRLINLKNFYGFVLYDFNTQVVCSFFYIFNIKLLAELAFEVFNDGSVPFNYYNIVHVDCYYEIRFYKNALKLLALSL
jgi:hypothetical protein